MKKAGDIWEIDGRKGKLTIQLSEDVDDKSDSFFEATILKGNSQYISIDANMAQKVHGRGTPGHVENFRTSLVTWKRKIKKEVKK